MDKSAKYQVAALDGNSAALRCCNWIWSLLKLEPFRQTYQGFPMDYYPGIFFNDQRDLTGQIFLRYCS